MPISLKAISGGSSVIKSVQRGSTSGDNEIIDITITAVNMSKSFVIGSWKTGNTAGSGATWQLTSATNLRIFTGDATSGFPITIEWQVVEYV